MKRVVIACILCCVTMLHAQQNSISPNLVKTCTICHGVQGQSPNPQWPHLAGQHPQYFIKQLQDMKNPALREVPMMSALIGTLSPKDLDDLAAYYAKMKPIQGNTPTKYLKRGEQLYKLGDFTQRITACIACHGPKGMGNPKAGFPLIAGQNAAYIMVQLNAFKDGKRNNDLNHIMHSISSRMKQEDMEAVAHYIEGLH